MLKNKYPVTLDTNRLKVNTGKGFRNVTRGMTHMSLIKK
jgi:hypothetical protein